MGQRGRAVVCDRYKSANKASPSSDGRSVLPAPAQSLFASPRWLSVARSLNPRPLLSAPSAPVCTLFAVSLAARFKKMAPKNNQSKDVSRGNQMRTTAAAAPSEDEFQFVNVDHTDVLPSPMMVAGAGEEVVVDVDVEEVSGADVEEVAGVDVKKVPGVDVEEVAGGDVTAHKKGTAKDVYLVDYEHAMPGFLYKARHGKVFSSRVKQTAAKSWGGRAIRRDLPSHRMRGEASKVGVSLEHYLKVVKDEPMASAAIAAERASERSSERAAARSRSGKSKAVPRTGSSMPYLGSVGFLAAEAAAYAAQQSRPVFHGGPSHGTRGLEAGGSSMRLESGRLGARGSTGGGTATSAGVAGVSNAAAGQQADEYVRAPEATSGAPGHFGADHHADGAELPSSCATDARAPKEGLAGSSFAGARSYCGSAGPSRASVAFRPQMDGVSTHEEALAEADAAQAAAMGTLAAASMTTSKAPAVTTHLGAAASGQSTLASPVVASGCDGGGSGPESGLRTPPTRGGRTGFPGIATPPSRVLRDSAGRFLSPRSRSGAPPPASTPRGTRDALPARSEVIDVNAAGTAIAADVVDVASDHEVATEATRAAAAARVNANEVELVDVFVAPQVGAWVTAGSGGPSQAAGGGSMHPAGHNNVAGVTNPPRSGTAPGRRGVVRFAPPLAGTSSGPSAVRARTVALPHSVAAPPPVMQQAPSLAAASSNNDGEEAEFLDGTPPRSPRAGSTPPRSPSALPSSSKRRRRDVRGVEASEVVTLEDLATLLKTGLASVRGESTRLRGEMTIVKSQSASVLRKLDSMASEADADGGGLRNVLDRLANVEYILKGIQNSVPAQGSSDQGQRETTKDKDVDMINNIKVSLGAHRRNLYMELGVRFFDSSMLFSGCLPTGYVQSLLLQSAF